MYLAWDTGVLDVLLPELSSLLYDSFGASTSKDRTPGDRVFRLLEWLDRSVAERGALDDVVLWTLLLLEPLKESTDGARDRNAASAELLDPLLERLAIPRRIADAMRRIVSVLPRITSGKVGRFARTELFDAAVDVAEADLFARGLPLDPVLDLRRAAGEAPSAPRPARAPFSGRARPTPRH